MAGSFHDDLHDPDLFTNNQPGSYAYGFNSSGGKTASGSLHLEAAPRDGKAQSAAGGEERRGSDHEYGADDGGHLIGARFGGETVEGNLVAQNRNLNRQDYKRMEEDWAAHLRNGDKVYVHIETDDPQRPNALMGYVIYEKPDGTRDWDTFHMVNESRSEIAKWEESVPDYVDVGEEADRARMQGKNTYVDVNGKTAGNAAVYAETAGKTAGVTTETNDYGVAPNTETPTTANDYAGQTTETAPQNDYVGVETTADLTGGNTEGAEADSSMDND